MNANIAFVSLSELDKSGCVRFSVRFTLMVIRKMSNNHRSSATAEKDFRQGKGLWRLAS